MVVCDCECHLVPDAVDKIDWKCRKCNHDLKKDFDRVMKQREEEAKEAVKNQRVAELKRAIDEIENPPSKEVKIS